MTYSLEVTFYSPNWCRSGMSEVEDMTDLIILMSSFEDSSPEFGDLDEIVSSFA